MLGFGSFTCNVQTSRPSIATNRRCLHTRRDHFSQFGVIESSYVSPYKKCIFLNYSSVEEATAAVIYHYKNSLDFPINFQPVAADVRLPPLFLWQHRTNDG
jgi:hypothetical protein